MLRSATVTAYCSGMDWRQPAILDRKSGGLGAPEHRRSYVGQERGSGSALGVTGQVAAVG